MEEEHNSNSAPRAVAPVPRPLRFYKAYQGRKTGGEKILDETAGLDMSMQGLRMLSHKIANWDTLTTLCLSYNRISEIPEELCKLTCLTVLDLSHNRIKKVPKELGRLHSLRELKLGSNLLSSVPLDFGMLYQMERLDLDDNPLIGQIQAVYNTSGGLGVIRYCRDNVAMNFPYWEREWIFALQDESTVREYNETITVATYNILCPTYASSQSFSYVPAWALQWEARKPTILQEATSYGADILCIQEMDTGSYSDYFRDQFKARGDYDSVFYQKSRARTMVEGEKRMVDGCATFWKGSFFQLVEHRCIYLSQLFPQKTISEHEHIANRFLSKDNIGLIVVLVREGEKHTVVVNTHIHWDPEYPDVKTLQGIMLLKEIDTIMNRYPQAELVICGDFNSLPNSSLYEMYSSGVLKPNSKDLMNLSYEPYSNKGYSHSLGLSESYSFVNMGFTNCTPGFSGVIDYIWYNSRLKPVCSLGPIDEEYVSKIVGLPTHHYPSDHLILVTQFKCKGGPWKSNMNK
ncbi:CCR4-NOT transcription complex subunit 6 [Nematocida major]|uniref:CCR4-NOT transcription complex subunit 6 n=1 Tax=Nematocida major TaxID=1912982 RepID=UPI002008075B|nr:CCR4-NOT transcription complex subunit 6 [Nematocida major]KAH9385483.1 CCR4-NOT transcription complex subunit 6 [Nematocida major]